MTSGSPSAAREARAFWVAAPGYGEIRAEHLPPAAPGEVTVRTAYSGISRGTEAIVFQGRVPESEHERMRAPFQSGAFPAPVRYGYANVGLVETGPPELIDRAVFTLYPHQTRFVVPIDAVHAIPAAVPPARAVLAANMETAVNGLWDARPQIGDRVAIVGAGTVGCLVAWLAGRIPGCEVELIDVNPRRAEIAQALGVAFRTPDHASTGADAVIHVSGSPAGLTLALQIAGFEASVTEMSWYGDASVAAPLGGRFHSQRLTIRSSQVGTVPPVQRSRWTTRRRMACALRLLADPAFDALISGESDFESLPTVMATLATTPGDTLCHRIRYS